jgi:Fe-S cluster assembly ATP-binding protein
MSILLITHYQRLLNYIKPDVVHVMVAGRIVKSGGPEVALELEAEGYKMYEDLEEVSTNGSAPGV